MNSEDKEEEANSYDNLINNPNFKLCSESDTDEKDYDMNEDDYMEKRY